MSRDIVIPEFGAFAKNLYTAYKYFYRDVETEIIDYGDYYKVVLYCKYALKKDWIFKIEIANNHLLPLIGYNDS